MARSRSFAQPAFAARGATGISRSSVPAIVFEGHTVPKVPLNTGLGMALAGAGVFLVGEGLVSLFASQDQGGWSTIFRLVRITVGGGMLVWVAASGN